MGKSPVQSICSSIRKHGGLLWSLGGDQKLLSLDDVLLPCLIYVLASSAGPHVLFYTRPVCASLSFTPEQLRDNVKAYVNAVKKDATILSDQIVKEVSEVVLSSTNTPGFSLNGEFYKGAPGEATPQQLSVA